MLASPHRSCHDARLDEVAPHLATLIADELDRSGIAFTPRNYAALLAPLGTLHLHLNRLHDVRLRAAAQQRVRARLAWAARLGLGDRETVRSRLRLSPEAFGIAEDLHFIRHVPLPYDLWDLGDTTGSRTSRYYPTAARLTARQRTVLDQKILRTRLAAGYHTGGLLARITSASARHAQRPGLTTWTKAPTKMRPPARTV